ncbi:uncharacterized protein TRIADDRAFT_54542 [Trichoplax adhaerens]|uniref:Cytochrome P450 n=1 Tax=Trichoplax adhaerens TaxID=10228 RepID=B3RSB9_TRIAD|nr:hypothetical protein TRIADDRAFT_54542 [Trichoplax adhaerens]EDV26487.1 hypothetical protein TRIADDRAFT_54542 [Trichoplax adhaerens]|eukprot:XP_002110483.1 hypothetical protein TRIADDRAFT_54542 [Trichoplax adhaerens]
MVSFFWCTVIALIIFWFYVKFIVPLRYFKRLGIPGPSPIPIIGTLAADTKDGKGNHEVQQIHLEKYGRVYGFFVGSMPAYVVGDLDIIKNILIKEFPAFSNRAMFFKTPGLEKSLANLRDTDWKRIRTVLNPTYTTSKMKQMFPLVNDSVDTFIRKMERVADKNQSIDVSDWLKQLSLEIITASAFGAKCNVQNGGHDRLINSATAIFKMNPTVIALSFMMPRLAPLFAAFDKSFMNGVKYIDKAVASIIKMRRQEGATGANYKDLLQLMIDASAAAESNKSLTDNEIIAQSSTIMLAGYETTSSCATFTAYLLANNSEVQDKLIHEIAKVCGKQEVTYDMLGQMTYLNKVIHESLRMYPPGYILLREATTTFQCNGYTFPKGIPIFIPAYALHHDNDIWPEPYRFNPERFNKDLVEARHPCAYMPFGLGPRNCIETEIPIQVTAATTLAPKNSVYLRVMSHTS